MTGDRHGHLRYVSASGSLLFEEGKASGTLPGSMRVHFDVGATFSGSFTIYTTAGSITGHGAADAARLGRVRKLLRVAHRDRRQRPLRARHGEARGCTARSTATPTRCSYRRPAHSTTEDSSGDATNIALRRLLPQAAVLCACLPRARGEPTAAQAGDLGDAQREVHARAAWSAHHARFRLQLLSPPPGRFRPR